MSGPNPDTFDDLLRRWRSMTSWQREDALSCLRRAADKVEDIEERTAFPPTSEAPLLRLAARLLQAAGESR